MNMNRTKFEEMMHTISKGLQNSYGLEFNGSIMVYFNKTDKVVDQFNNGLSIPLVIKHGEVFYNYLVCKDGNSVFLEEFDEIYEVDIMNALGITDMKTEMATLN